MAESAILRGTTNLLWRYFERILRVIPRLGDRDWLKGNLIGDKSQEAILRNGVVDPFFLKKCENQTSQVPKEEIMKIG
jgi:hypothetical protein